MTPLVPPSAAKRPVERVRWGHRVVDEYSWLADADADADRTEAIALLRAEKDYAERALAPSAEREQELFEELRSRIVETDLSVPATKDAWSYYSRTEEGLAYPIHCRRPASGGDEQILLDENAEAEGHDYFDIGVFELCPGHLHLIWGTDTSGDERFTLRFKTVADDGTQEVLPDRIDGASYGSAFSSDGQYLFYTTADQANRTNRVWRHRLGEPAASDVLVFSEPDEAFTCGVGRDTDDVHIMIQSSSVTSDELWLIAADEPMAPPSLVQPRTPGLEYSATFHGSELVLLTNLESPDFSVMVADGPDYGVDSWRSLVTEEDSVTLGGIEVFDDFLVLFERTEAIARIRIMSWDQDGTVGRIDYIVDQDETVYSTWAGANPTPSSRYLRFGYSSMVTPASVYRVEMATGHRELLKQTEVRGGFNPDDYQTERLWASAADGTRIPISLVTHRDRPDGPGPCVLYGYGAYEISIDPAFSVARLLLLDRGFAFAIAHVRGGGEMGRSWYEGGKLERKPNSFTDFVAAGRYLIETGWAAPGALTARGGSAGGLLVGAAMNLDPSLFSCVVAEVPFVDALNTILDPSLPLTIGEWEEWGNPAESREIYQTMADYSPYENVSAGPHPAVLATTGLNDPRVAFWEPAKWVQRLRDTNTGTNPILLWPDLDSGHGGPSGRYDAWLREARVLSFILEWAGIT